MKTHHRIVTLVCIALCLAPVGAAGSGEGVGTGRVAGAAEVGGVAGAGGTAPAPVIRFVNGMWYDGEGFAPRQRMYSVRGVFRESYDGPVDRVVDLAGKYMVPPLGDAHHHNHTRERLLAFVQEGVFYVKNPANLPRELKGVRRFLNRPNRVDVVFAGGVLTAPGGHPVEIADRNIAEGDWTEEDGEGGFYWELVDEDDLEAKWPAFLRQPRDFVKTFLLYSEHYADHAEDDAYYGLRGLDPELLARIVERAHAEGLLVTTHVESVADFRAAIAAGVDEINHLPGFRPDPEVLADEGFKPYRLKARDARAAARAGVRVVTTVGGLVEGLRALIDDPETGPADRRVARKYRRIVRRNLRWLKRRDVPVLVGGDRFEERTVAEVRALQELKVFDTGELLRMWAVTTPRGIFPARAIGALEEGFEASLLVLGGDPLEDLSELERIEMRLKQGRSLD